MSKQNHISIKIILLILVISIGIVFTSCSYLKGGYNYLFNRLSDAEWQTAMSLRNFNNVTISESGDPIKIVAGVPYMDGERLLDEDVLMVFETIFGIIDNCDYGDFKYDYKNNVYSCDEVSYNFVYFVDELGMNVTISAIAKNVILSFNAEKELEEMQMDLSYEIEVLGYRETENIGGVDLTFDNYGTTAIRK